MRQRRLSLPPIVLARLLLRFARAAADAANALTGWQDTRL